MKGVVALLLAAFTALASADVAKRYDGYKVLRIQVENESQAEILSKLEKRDLFDFWTHILSLIHI